jgi:UDP-N-acetylglucosamine--N-acetylmuramyl-(pentapeptide) pyrophosphoryl-undecaprenol N-acetylglucosamine transferase
VVGAAGPATLPRSSEHRVRFDGWVDDAGLHLAAADVVVASAGSNLVAEVAMAARPLIAVAERRPFEEQLRRVEGLSRLGVAVGLPKWPSGDTWAPLVSRARSLGGDRLKALAGGTTPADCARWIVATAGAALLPDTRDTRDTPEGSVR